ncbi:hypothetical protein [Streptomyces sp. NPDC001792]|uniref:YxiG-like protein n=1 Tax=unclassified Streptomyces TaxID=2593676 RepID=UPI003320B20E
MDAAALQHMLDEVFDQALVHHGFTGYLRDYEVIVHATADPRTGRPARLPAVSLQALRRGPVRAVGVDFHEVRIETSAQRLTLLFSDLRVSEAPTGYAPFTTG